jgi:hypothetical protein
MAHEPAAGSVKAVASKAVVIHDTLVWLLHILL